MIRDRLLTVLWMGVGAGVAMMVAGGMQSGKGDIIEARRIILRDEKGTPRLYLIADSEAGSPWVSLHDEDGDPRLVFRIQGRGRPEIQFFGKTGPALAELTLTADGLPELTMKGTNSALVIGIDRKGQPSLSLYGNNPEISLDDHYTEASKVISLKGEPVQEEAAP